jgi:hypothetical protein
MHRSLGAHISKVRSLTIDRLDSLTETILFRLGNTAVNSILEKHFPEGFRKAIPGDLERKIREYITNKYSKKLFMTLEGAPMGTAVERAKQLSQAIHKAIKDDDLVMMLQAIFHGASPNAVDEEGRTPLMNAALDGNLEAMLLLLSNGSHSTLFDNAGKSVIDYALMGPEAHQALGLLAPHIPTPRQVWNTDIKTLNDHQLLVLKHHFPTLLSPKPLDLSSTKHDDFNRPKSIRSVRASAVFGSLRSLTTRRSVDTTSI